jgi:hypothetical protein
MPIVTEAQLAKLLKRNRTAIRQAAANGRITRRPDGLFDSEQAIQEFEASTLHERGHNNKKQPVEIPTAEIPNASQAKGTDYAKARAGSMAYDALLKKARYEKLIKNLVPVTDVEDAATQNYQILRGACENIPLRIAPQVATESSIERCQQILEREIAQVFNAFSDGTLT